LDFCWILPVSAGAEAVLGPTENDRIYVCFFPKRNGGLMELFDQLHVKRISLLWAVDANDRYAIMSFGRQLLLCHYRSRD
jgi:hypothetical protein